MHLYAALDDRLLVVRAERQPEENALDGVRSTAHLAGRDLESLAASPAVPDRVFVGTVDDGLRRSSDGGQTWEAVGGFEDRVTAVTVSPHDPDVIWAGTEPSAVYRSTDGGDTWQHPQDGLEHRYVWGLAVDPGDPATVVASAASGARTAHTPSRAESSVYRKRGDSWELAMDGLPGPDGTARAVLATGTTDRELFALTNRGLFRTMDAADSWSHVGIDWPDDYRERVGRGLAVVE